MNKQGEVAVAKYYPTKDRLPFKQGFRPVLIHVKEPLSPYVLANEQGHLLENIWQFSKVYERVEEQEIHLSSKHPNSRIIWEHPAEVHIESGALTPAYFDWREKGMRNAYAVRYPNGFQGRHKCLYSFWEGEKLDYVAARKKIYCGEYARLAPPTKAFKELYSALHERGENLLLIEVDGPDPTLTYPPYDQISTANPCMIMNEKNIRLLVNDEKKPFGHGFVLAALLLDGAEWMN